MTNLGFAAIVVVLLVLVLLAIQKLAPVLKASGTLETLLEVIAILIAIAAILQYTGLGKL